MPTVILVLSLVLAVIISTTISEKITIIPPALIQVLVGLILSLVPNFQHFVFNPELFMLVIIAPLMFHDGFTSNINMLRRSLGNTMSLSIGLAVVTILVVGGITHLIIPTLPLALAFALGAIITPTDAVAVSSVTQNLDVPESSMNLLENESLFNDASGIVAFDLALITFETGNFSAWFSVLDYIYVFFGGLLLGWVAGRLTARVQSMLIDAQMDNPNIIVPLNLMVPFILYLLAEKLGMSGILAVVAAGLVLSTMHQRMRLTSTRIQIVATTTWEVISNIMNGFVFILLGVSLPTVITDITKGGIQVSSIGTLLSIAIVLYITMILLRFFWAKLRLLNFSMPANERHFNDFLIAINGIHGTITLAMAFSIPLLYKGQRFPFRNDIIFVAATVIILSIIIPTILLPFVLPKKSNSYSVEDVDLQLEKMVTYAITKIQELDEDPVEIQAVIATLESQRINHRIPKHREIYRIFQECNNLELAQLQKLVDDGKITAKEQDTYQRFLLAQSNYMGQTAIQSAINWIKYFTIRFFRRITSRSQQQQIQAHVKKSKIIKLGISEIETQLSPTIFEHLIEISNPNNRDTINWLQRYYRERHRRFQTDVKNIEIQDDLFITAFQHEYTFVQNQLTKGIIPREVASLLYEQISNDEVVIMQNDGLYD